MSDSLNDGPKNLGVSTSLNAIRVVKPPPPLFLFLEFSSLLENSSRFSFLE